MSSDKLGCRMHHNIRAELKRPDQIRRSERIVHNKRDFMCMRNLRHRLHIHNIAARVSQGFNKQQFGFLCYRPLKVFRIVRVYKNRMDTKPGQRRFKQIMRPSVQRGSGDDLISRLRDIQNGIGDARRIPKPRPARLRRPPAPPCVFRRHLPSDS